jgi:hypothetical protein
VASIDSEVDGLFKLALAEFTAARNALSSRLQKAGDKDAAASVKALSKPPISAWVVNQLYWRHRNAFDRLLSAGARLRQAQASQLAGQVSNLREILATHRETLTELSRQAAAILAESGHQPSPDVMRRVTMTLEGLAAQGLLEGAPAAGRLTADVDPPGFETISALAPRQPGDKPRRQSGDARVLAFRADRRVPADGKAAKKGPRDAASAAEAKAREAERRKAAQAALKQAERALAEAKRDAATAEAAMKKAATRLKDTEKEKKDLEARLDKATAAADAARQAARKTAAEAADAAQVVEDAERAVDAAREQLEE